MPEARREDDRTIHDWLDTIRNRGGDSPVIVVINKCDEGVTDNLGLDEKRLKAEYENIVEFVRTSCDPGEAAAASIDVLRRAICETLSGDRRLDEIRSPYPAPYLRIRRDIGELAREESVLRQREFERLCEEPNRARPESGVAGVERSEPPAGAEQTSAKLGGSRCSTPATRDSATHE